MSGGTEAADSDIPENRCGYTYPAGFDVEENPDPDQQNCCARRPLPDTERCRVHADTDDSDTKAEQLEETVLAADSLDGAILVGELAENVFFHNTALLREADLSEVDFTQVRMSDETPTNPHAKKRDLAGANLTGADLSSANLNGADLSEATLAGADLSNANLERANLQAANLTGADLSSANLTSADLQAANLTDADLSEADLRRTTLAGTIFTDARLSRVDLRGTSITGEQLTQAELHEVITTTSDVENLPEELATQDDGAGERLRTVDAMTEDTPDVCGHTSFTDEHFWTGETPQRSTCFLPTVDDADRCLWHVSPLKTDEQKTTTALAEHLADLRVREDLPRGQLVDEARLDQMEVDAEADRDADLRHLSLRDVSLSGTSQSTKDLSRVLLSHSDLSGADLTNTNLSTANLGETNLSGADLRETNLSEAYLHGADLSEAELSSKIDAEGVDMSGANLIDATLAKANLGSVDLSGANLNGADLPEASLYETDLSNNVRLSRADLSGADLRRADLSEAELHDANLSKAELTDVDLREAELDRAQLHDAELTEAMLTSADCEEAEFTRAKLTRATFEAADITGADFTQSFLFQTRFAGAQINGRTQFCEEGEIGDTTTPNYCRYDTEALPDSALASIEKEQAAIDSEAESAALLKNRYARSTYRRLEALAQENGFPDLQSEMFIRRQDARRDLLFQQGQQLKGTFAWIQDQLFRYGESFSRIAAVSVGIILVGWIVYMFTGVVETQGGQAITVSVVADDPSLAIDTLLNSVSIFFAGTRTLPTAGQVGEIIAVTQSAIGPILVALLIFVLGRRAAR